MALGTLWLSGWEGRRPGPPGGGPGLLASEVPVDGVVPDGWEVMPSSICIEGRLVDLDVYGLLDHSRKPLRFDSQDHWWRWYDPVGPDGCVVRPPSWLYWVSDVHWIWLSVSALIPRHSQLHTNEWMNELVVLRPHLTAKVIFADVEMLMIITISPENPSPFPFIGPYHWYVVAKRESRLVYK